MRRIVALSVVLICVLIDSRVGVAEPVAAGSPLDTTMRTPVQTALAAPDQATLMREGRLEYMRSCASCHGVNGEGGYGPRLIESQVVSDWIFLIGQIFHGTESGMSPPFIDEFTDRQVAAVASFVRNSWGNQYGIVLPADVASARPRRSQIRRRTSTTRRGRKPLA